MASRWPPLPSPLLLAGALALGGCAHPVPAPEPVAPVDHGVQALIVQPGDAEASYRALSRISISRPDDAKSLPVQWETEIRNRCTVPASFAIGPKDAEIGPDVPIHTLEPGEGVSTSMADDEYVLLITAPGESAVRASGRWVILQGGNRCDHMTALNE